MALNDILSYIKKINNIKEYSFITSDKKFPLQSKLLIEE